jgi:hypothetical protein
MRFWPILTRALAALALVGLLAAPVSAPMAAGPAQSGMSMDMAEAMPCCPDDKPVMPDCAKTCPLMMVCLSKCFQPMSAAGSPIPAFALVAVILPGNDAVPDGLARPPPARPPRSIS